MGLSGCRGLVVAPFNVTFGKNLGGRYFFYSYDADRDQSGDKLQALFAGAVRIAIALNASYALCVAGTELTDAQKASSPLVGRQFFCGINC